MENPSLQRQMGFNGLAIYYSAYAKLGVDKTIAGDLEFELEEELGMPGDDKESNSQEKEAINLVTAGDKELKELCKLIDPWESIDETTEIGKEPV